MKTAKNDNLFKNKPAKTGKTQDFMKFDALVLTFMNCNGIKNI